MQKWFVTPCSFAKNFPQRKENSYLAANPTSLNFSEKIVEKTDIGYKIK
jgi:hypothetical protein